MVIDFYGGREIKSSRLQPDGLAARTRANLKSRQRHVSELSTPELTLFGFCSLTGFYCQLWKTRSSGNNVRETFKMLSKCRPPCVAVQIEEIADKLTSLAHQICA